MELTFTEPAWDDTLDLFHYFDLDKRLSGSALINGSYFDSVGVRYKGFSSFNPSRVKNPLNVKLDYIIEDQKIDGYGTLKLSNGFKDPSFIREVLGYEIVRKYMPSSWANFIKVYINDEHIGLYTSVQSVDKFFLRNFYHGDSGVFIKGNPQRNPGGRNLRGAATLKYLGDDSTDYYDSYEMLSASGWSDLIELCDILNNNTAQIETVFNVDRALWLMAFHNVLVSLDSPINAPRNFYLYKDATNRFCHIPWDLNMTFGTYKTGLGISVTIADLQKLDPLYNIDNTTYPLVSKLLAIPKYKKIYIAHMRTILSENFTNGWYIMRAKEIRDIIKHDVSDDPNKFYSFQDFFDNLYTSIVGDNIEIVGLEQLMEARIDFLQSHTEFQYITPEISNLIINPEQVNPYSPVSFNVQVEDVDSVYFVYRNNIFERFKKLQMFDDGDHQDGNARDGIYGLSIQTMANDIQYYIFAENENAVEFYPQQAQYKYHTLPVIGDMVINEFQALNDTTVTDQDGEFDDWIELFNNSDKPLSLEGYHLTDDSTDLTKWTFPDTTIDSNRFMIIWADRDGNQSGLHASFRISGDGEELLLVDQNLVVLDHVVFGVQKNDCSMGRSPNGTGPFYEMTPTFAAENEKIVNTEKKDDPQIADKYILYQNYPNPFNPLTFINFELPQTERIRLTIYDILGRKVKVLIDDRLEAGLYSIPWKGRDQQGNRVASGIYLYQLKAGNNVRIKKMTFLH